MGQIFEDYPEVDCNKCEPYWNNQCDGAVTGSTRLCTAFKPVRRVNIPEEVEGLRSAVKWLTASVVLLAISQIIHCVGCLMGG